MAVPLTLIILLLITGTNMTSTNIYIQSRIDGLEELLADSHIKLFTIKYSKTDTPSINGNLIHNKKVVDHMFSVYEGFHRNIPPYIIGSIYNLKVIPWRENISKSSSNSISEEELFDRFYKETTNSPTDSPSSIDFS